MKQSKKQPYLITILLLITLITQPSHANKIQILCTTDIHGYIQHSDKKNSGGWLRIATLIKKERQNYGKNKTLLIDCGDTTQGTIYTAQTQGTISIQILNALKYDAWIPGNHELDYGIKQYQKLTKQATCTILGGNVTINNKKQKTWQIYHRDNLSIAIIGANSSFLPNWFRYNQLKTEKTTTMLKRELPKILKQKPDIIILAIHQGWKYKDPRKVNEVKQISKQFPEIDLILGGHTHRLFPGMTIGHRTWYVQAGMHANHLAKIIIDYNPQTKQIKNIKSHLIPATHAIPKDPQISKLIQPTINKINKYSKQKITTLNKAILAKGTPGKNCQISELICSAIRQASHTQIILQGKHSNYNLYPKRPITPKDIFAIIPYENKIITAQITPNQLKQILQEQQQNKKYKTAYCGISGIKIIYNQNGTITIPKNLPKKIKIALNSYTANSGGGRFPILKKIIQAPEANYTDTNITTRTALTNYLKKQKQTYNLMPTE